MLERLKQNWHEFKHARPGHRFSERYGRRQRESGGRFGAGAVVNILLGLAIAALGVVFIPAPGPGSMIIFLGLGLIGSEFRPLANFLDWAELQARALVDWAKALWAAASLPVKALISLLLFACVAGVSYGGYELFFEGSSNSRE